MRTFAKTLNVSFITVQKAYEILQEEGFITSVVGKGKFVQIPQINVYTYNTREPKIYAGVWLLNKICPGIIFDAKIMQTEYKWISFFTEGKFVVWEKKA